MIMRERHNELYGFKPPKYFKLQELVPRDIYERYGQTAWQFLDSRLLYSLYVLRCAIKKPFTVNTWYYGGHLQHKGLRPFVCKDGAQYSQHKLGRAIDFTVEGMFAAEVRQFIYENIDNLNLYITYMEDTVDWVHIDVRNSDYDHLHLFQPS